MIATRPPHEDRFVHEHLDQIDQIDLLTWRERLEIAAVLALGLAAWVVVATLLLLL